jgi:hypothetical protein
MSSSHSAISLVVICLLVTCVTTWTATELVIVSLRFHTHIHGVFGHQFCGFVSLNFYYCKLKNSILLIEFGEVCCWTGRAWASCLMYMALWRHSTCTIRWCEVQLRALGELTHGYGESDVKIVILTEVSLLTGFVLLCHWRMVWHVGSAKISMLFDCDVNWLPQDAWQRQGGHLVRWFFQLPA